MVAGRGTPDQAEARLWAYRDRASFQALVDLLCEVSLEYLSGQVRAGAEVLQIFDSWAGSLPDTEFARWVVAPTMRLVSALKERHPAVPIIGFPRGAGDKLTSYVAATRVDGISCDSGVPLALMAGELSTRVTVQGNLDPLALVAGGTALAARALEILAALRGKRFIFNLGHGIVPETPPENVAVLVDLVRGQQPT
jgi:uroporphyrinogen decarboxylase